MQDGVLTISTAWDNEGGSCAHLALVIISKLLAAQLLMQSLELLLVLFFLGQHLCMALLLLLPDGHLLPQPVLNLILRALLGEALGSPRPTHCAPGESGVL